jgi:FkbH-like protein
LSAAKISEEKERVCRFIDDVLAGIRRQSSAMILWSGLELPIYPIMGILDAQDEHSQSAVICELNNYLRARLREFDSAYYLDINMILSRLGADRFYDYRYWHIGKAPYSRAALQETAAEIIKYLRPVMGKTRKCLVLDCDNTLWGGVIGEDGLASILLGSTYPGSPYHAFQQEIVNLYHRGVLIALCSKNNPEDVWAVFDQHPDMVLERKHIASAQINWNDKASNLRQIASDLNIGLDSLVYIDDSEFEINLVNSILPEVAAIHAGKDRSVEYRDMLASCGYFDNLSISNEDRKRGAMYRSEVQRKEFRAGSSDLESYLLSLEMVLEISLVTDFSVPRIAQLTQKTNQFNLTTRRYTEADIKLMADDSGTDVIQLQLRDRFGEMGIIGTCIVKYSGSNAHIDSFMLSCRALGRGVEHAFLHRVVDRAESRAVKTLTGEYIPTRKNEQVSEFFVKKGFNIVGDKDGERRYEIYPASYEGDQQYLFKEILCSFDNSTVDEV